jgi:tetratricopeptide (TPR) repeat protein
MEFLKHFVFGSMIILMMSAMAYGQEVMTLENRFKASYEKENEGDYNGAIDIIKGAYDEASYEINLRLGWLHYMSGLFTESSTYYQRAMSLKPYAIEPVLGYVMPVSAMGNWEIVRNQYLQILEKDPANTLVNYRMGLIYYGIQDYETAAGYFKNVVNLYPFDYDAVIMLAWSDYFLGKYREAKVLFSKALLILPGNESAMEGLSLIK